MNKYVAWSLGIILLVGLISAGGMIGEIINEQASITSSKVDLTLDTATKEKLANMDSKVEQSCNEWITNCLEREAYPEIVCEKWIDERMETCEVWTQPKECIDFDAKIGVCLKWDYEPVCIKEETVCNAWQENTIPIGITSVKITKVSDECYDFISEPMLHRYNTCIGSQDPVEYARKDLEMIASNIKTPEEKARIDENIEVIEITIK